MIPMNIADYKYNGERSYTTTKITEYALRYYDNIVVVKTETILNHGDPRYSYELELVFNKNKKYLKDSRPILVSPKFFDQIKKYNPFHHHKIDFGIIDDFDLNTLDKTYPDLDIVLFDNSSHLLFNCDGIPISYARGFDYIGTPFSSVVCDIKKLYEHLKKHSWVVNPKDLKIKNIPYYNNDSGSDEYIENLVLYPDQKSYEEIFHTAMKNKGSGHFSCQMSDIISHCHYIESKDYLNIDQFKINKSN